MLLHSVIPSMLTHFSENRFTPGLSSIHLFALSWTPVWRLTYTISSSISTYSVHSMTRTHFPCSHPPLHHFFSCSKRKKRRKKKPLLAVSSSKPPTEKGTSCPFVCRFAQGFRIHHRHTTWGSVFTLPTGCWPASWISSFLFQGPVWGKKRWNQLPGPQKVSLRWDFHSPASMHLFKPLLLKVVEECINKDNVLVKCVDFEGKKSKHHSLYWTN